MNPRRIIPLVLLAAGFAGCASPRPMTDAERMALIDLYVREANEGAGAPGGEPIMHLVPETLERAILARDGHRCVICGRRSTIKVDHKRALINGGDNSPGNLVTLCEPCRTMKWQRDHALQVKREKR